jgi:outer membrane immunogenic protein
MTARSLLLAAVALAATAAAPALAADMPVKAPVFKPQPVLVPDWNGVYVGAHAGYAFGVSRFDPATFNTDFLSSRGFTGGVLAGYNLMLSSRFLVGVEIDASWSRIRHESVTPDLGAGLTTTFTLQQSRSYAARARLGFLLTPETLLYGTAGWTRAEVAYSFAAPALPFFESSAQWVNGVQVGAGIEARLGGPWGARLEYLHTFYNTQTVDSAIFGVFDTKPSVGVGRVALIAHFGPQAAAAPGWAAPATMPSWSGIYVGGGIGPGAGSAKVETVTAGNIPLPGFTLDGVGGAGVWPAVLGGFNVRVAERVVAGVEAEVAPGISRTDFKLDPTVAVRGRIGFLITPTNLVFATAGVVTTAIKATSLAGGQITIPSQHVNALQVGGGLESAITENWMARFSYQYASAQALDNITATIAGQPWVFTARPQWHYGEVALVYLLGGR